MLVDCGMDKPGSLRDLERALEPAGFAVEDVRLLVCTHAHVDHCGQAFTVQARSGCELWIHPRREHQNRGGPGSGMSGPLEVARELVPGRH